MADQIPFSISPQHGSCFDASSNGQYDPGAAQFGPLTFNFQNKATTWVDVVVDIMYPVDRSGTVFNTGHIQPNGNDQRQVPNLQGCALHIYRWAPGFLGIPGSGGGEIEFVVPETGQNGIANITVVDPH